MKGMLTMRSELSLDIEGISELRLGIQGINIKLREHHRVTCTEYFL